MNSLGSDLQSQIAGDNRAVADQVSILGLSDAALAMASRMRVVQDQHNVGLRRVSKNAIEISKNTTVVDVWPC